MTAKKHDTGKPRLDLVRPEFTEGIARVLGFGLDKYGAWNWAEGIEFSRVIAALERHINAFKKGVNLDDETNENHLYHAGCCLMFLSCYQEWGMTKLDDRYIVDSSIDALINDELRKAEQYYMEMYADKLNKKWMDNNANK